MRQEAVQQSVVPGVLARKSLVQEAGSKPEIRLTQDASKQKRNRGGDNNTKKLACQQDTIAPSASTGSGCRWRLRLPGVATHLGPDYYCSSM